ncbi:MAG: hypothetical protein AB8I58_14685 [Anaerolineales bacterium]|jgi:hypothetical protein
MKRIITGFVILFSLSACSMNDVLALLVTPTAPALDTSTPTVFYTPSYTPTISPTPPTPTYTATPTPVGANSVDEDVPVFTPFPTSTPEPQISLFGSQSSLLISMSVSSDVLYWGYCDDPHYVDFDVRLANNLRVRYVLLFMRLVDKGGNQSTAWGGGAIMQKVNGSYYTYRVRPENISYYEEFKDAWIEYQVVVTTSYQRTLARTPAYRENLSLKWCRPVEVDE